MATRRSILGMLAGAPVAASAIGNQAVGQAIAEKSTLNRAKALGGLALPTEGDWLKEQIGSLRKELADLGKDRAEQVARIRRNITHVDPDLAAMRSLSDSAKQRLQAERNYDRDLAEHKTWLGRRLDDLLTKSA